MSELDEKLDSSTNLMDMRVCLHLSDQTKCEKSIHAITGNSAAEQTLKMHLLRLWSRHRRALAGLYGIIHALGTMKDQTRMRGIHMEMKDVVKQFCNTNQHMQTEVIATDAVMESATTVSLQMEQLTEIMAGSFLVENGNNISTDEQLLAEFDQVHAVDSDISDPKCQNIGLRRESARPSAKQKS